MSASGEKLVYLRLCLGTPADFLILLNGFFVKSFIWGYLLHSGSPFFTANKYHVIFSIFS